MDVKMVIENPDEVICMVQISMSLKSWKKVEKDLMGLEASQVSRELARRIQNTTYDMQQVIVGRGEEGKEEGE